MRLKFYTKEGKKIYTLNSSHEGKETKEAHYKFIKMKDASEKDYNNS